MMIKSRTLFFLSSALLLLSVLPGSLIYAQTVTNKAALQKQSQDLATRHAAMQKLILQKAREKGWPLTLRSKKGRLAYLQAIDAQGRPVYITTTENIISAATI